MTTVFESSFSDLEPEMKTPWSEEVARRIAAEDGIGELTDSHWRVINTLREHFVQYGAMPPMQLACGMNSLNPRCVEELFHGSYEAWHIAGLPDPGSEAIDCL